jgi:hypothetical protein
MLTKAMEDEAYKKLLEQLKKACAEEDPLVRSIDAVMAARDFLSAHNVPDALTRPLEKAITTLIDVVTIKKHGNKPGPKPRPFNELTKIAAAAAAVEFDENHPTTVLDGFLKSVVEEKRKLELRPANFYQACIYAWNAYREDKTLTSVKYDTKKGLYTVAA